MTTYWRCMECSAWGQTNGTESSAEVKHVKATQHAIVTTTTPLGKADEK